MLDASVKDKAGNSASADPIAFVFDNKVARTTAPAVQGEITAGERFQMVASLNDDLSIRDYYVTVDFGEVPSLGVGLPVPVDAFDADPRMNRNHTVTVPAIGFGTPTPIMAPYAGTQSALGAIIRGDQPVSQWAFVTRHRHSTRSRRRDCHHRDGTLYRLQREGFAWWELHALRSAWTNVCVEGDDDMASMGAWSWTDPTTSDLEFVATSAT